MGVITQGLVELTTDELQNEAIRNKTCNVRAVGERVGVMH